MGAGTAQRDYRDAPSLTAVVSARLCDHDFRDVRARRFSAAGVGPTREENERMSYDSTRISEQLRVLEPEIYNFIVRYNASNGPPGFPRQTVFIFPGGMASRLRRAKTAFQPAGPPNQVFAYDEVWLNPATFLGGA